MPRKRPGIQSPGRERLRQNWEDIIGTEDQPPKEVQPTWLVGYPSEKDVALKEEIAATNLAEQQFMDTDEVESLPDLWPKRGVEEGGNYYQGPYKSTRVSRHRFIPEKTGLTGVTGTMYVEFTNMRPNGSIRRTNVYKYNKVPYAVYKSFTMTNSKGQFINKLTPVYNYERIDNPSVFSD